MHTEAQARTLGDKLLARLGATWELELWDNLGWHAAARLEGLRVHVSPDWVHHGPPTFSAYLNEPGHPGGIWAATAKDPETAIASVLAQARTMAEKYANIVNRTTAALDAARLATWAAPKESA